MKCRQGGRNTKEMLWRLLTNLEFGIHLIHQQEFVYYVILQHPLKKGSEHIFNLRKILYYSPLIWQLFSAMSLLIAIMWMWIKANNNNSSDLLPESKQQQKSIPLFFQVIQTISAVDRDESLEEHHFYFNLSVEDTNYSSFTIIDNQGNVIHL